jgi:hypothetical protein
VSRKTPCPQQGTLGIEGIRSADKKHIFTNDAVRERTTANHSRVYNAKLSQMFQIFRLQEFIVRMKTRGCVTPTLSQ